MIWLGVVVGTLACLAVSAVTAYGTMLVVVAKEREQKRLAARPICGCRHHVSFHDDTGCHHNAGGYHQNLSCGCQRYVGPKPPEVG